MRRKNIEKIINVIDANHRQIVSVCGGTYNDNRYSIQLLLK